MSFCLSLSTLLASHAAQQQELIHRIVMNVQQLNDLLETVNKEVKVCLCFIQISAERCLQELERRRDAVKYVSDTMTSFVAATSSASSGASKATAPALASRR